MAEKNEHVRFGRLEPCYRMALNPYPDLRISRCPSCQGKTGQRKLPLLIHVDPLNLIALNYTCRYCPGCELLVVHQHEIEGHLTQLFSQRDPAIIGNRYLIIGTVDRTAWRESMKHPMSPEQTRAQTHDFLRATTIETSVGNWFPRGMEPPLRPPVPSDRWSKP